ncbi:hypothetical protein AGOR_G00173130 [Albula goreensis]|uniref:Ig-like domain-containing protein n=1 Tax=Albula goreensis TaxID=1534307 RepID=A0A8T3CXP0_9TELE|nr:hypothetical protein AGOR_G00173130 [Albula goreensis]
MTNLKKEDSEYYWCAIEKSGADEHAFLHLSVTAGSAGVSSTKDSEYYWCAVERSGTDEGAYLYLSVTAGTPDLWVDKQEVTGVEGDSVSVQCHYSNYDNSVKKWCRIGGPCVEGNSGKDKSEIRDDRDRNVFTVMMRRLERKDTGWYWCAAGYLQIPVHITVTQRTTAAKVTTATKSSTSPLVTVTQRTTATTVFMTTKFSTSPTLTIPPVTTATTVIQASSSQWKTTKTLHPPSPAKTDPKQSPPVIPILLMAFGTLLLLLFVIIATWKLWRKCKNVQTESSRAEGRRDYPTMTLEPDVTYSTVMTKRKDKAQTKGSEDQVTYSTVFINTGSSCGPCEEPEDEVTYSSIILHNPQPAENTSNDATYSAVARQKKQGAAR